MDRSENRRSFEKTRSCELSALVRIQANDLDKGLRDGGAVFTKDCCCAATPEADAGRTQAYSEAHRHGPSG